MNLYDRIMFIAQSHGEVEIRDGIVYVTEPNGTLWSFTIPMVEEPIT